MSVAQEIFALPDARCAGCVLKIERSLSALPGVTEARGNATQKRVSVTWDDAQQSVETLRTAVQTLGYSFDRLRLDHAPDSGKTLYRQLGLAGFGMMNIMAFSISVWFGGVTDMGPGTTQFLHWLSAAIALPVAIYSGSVFHAPAVRALRRRRMTMDTPISIAIIVTYFASLIETLRGAEHVYFDAVVGLIFFLLIGRVLEHWLHRRSGDAAANLREFLAVSAERINADGTCETVQAEDLIIGERILVTAGARVPVDGEVLHGSAHVDESALTGEVSPRRVTCGQKIAAGSILLEGPIEITVTKVGAATEIGQMARMAEDVAAHKGDLQRLSDRFAKSYIPLVLGGGALGFLIWYLLLGATFGESVLIAVAVLIVTCPCAAGLATPAVTSRAMNIALSAGVVVKTGAALEHLGAITTVFLDKTGTASVISAALPDTMPAASQAEALALASASSHPMAQALTAEASVRPAQEVQEFPGQGIQNADGARLGSAAFTGAQQDSNGSLWFRAVSGEVISIETKEVARRGLQEFLVSMHHSNRPVSLMSGDRPGAVEGFAQTLQISDWWAEQSPAQKLAKVQQAQQQGHSVMMVGDGINDSVALSAANASVSFAQATEIAQNAADIVLTRPDFRHLAQVIQLAARARRLVRQNLQFSMVYNLIAVPLALIGQLTPALAALLMSASSIAVMANALRLRRIT